MFRLWGNPFSLKNRVKRLEQSLSMLEIDFMEDQHDLEVEASSIRLLEMNVNDLWQRLRALEEGAQTCRKERQREGIQIAKKEGKYRKARKLTNEQIEEAKALDVNGVPRTQIARNLGVSRQTLYTSCGWVKTQQQMSKGEHDNDRSN